MVGSQSLVPQGFRLVPPCALERECAPGPASRWERGSRHLRSPRRAPAPAHSRLLSLSISANRLQTERARRCVNAIGALPGGAGYITSPAQVRRGQNQPTGAPPATPCLQHSSGCARTPRGGTWPQPAPHSLARRGGSRAGRAHGIRDPVAAGHVSAPCVRDPARWAGETQAGARREC